MQYISGNMRATLRWLLAQSPVGNKVGFHFSPVRSTIDTRIGHISFHHGEVSPLSTVHVGTLVPSLAPVRSGMPDTLHLRLLISGPGN